MTGSMFYLVSMLGERLLVLLSVKFQSCLVFCFSVSPAPCSQLEKLIKRGVSVNALTKNNFSALHLSTYRVGDFRTIKKNNWYIVCPNLFVHLI